jgi:glutathionylspermidine synthase
VIANAQAVDYGALARELTATGILSDPWIDGRPRFAVAPLVLSGARARALTTAAEALTAAWDEAGRLCLADETLVGHFFPALTPFQRVMWSASGGAWHGIARADVFETDDGPRICELNCDTPSGEAEAVLLNAAVARRHPSLRDPNAGLERAFGDVALAYADGLDRDPTAPLTVGILYPTELVEDLSMVLLYRRWLEARGCRVILGSPFNLGRAGARAALFDVPCDLFVRHYKTDWWSEREPARDDEPPFSDAEPLAEQLGLLTEATLARRCAVINPFGSVLMQNKRVMALMWEAIERFSPASQAAIRAHLPYTVRLEGLPPAALRDRADWVIKSDYGCEGAEVTIGAAVDEATWNDALAHARPGRFVAQRFFTARAAEDGRSVNFGVYVVAGEAAGFFSRLDRGATDYHAVTAATLVDEMGDS